MLDAVSFGRRYIDYRRYDDNKNNNDEKLKAMSAGSSVAAAIAANKLANREISPDSVVLKLIKDQNAKDYSNLNTLKNIIKTMEEQNVTALTNENVAKLQKIGFAVDGRMSLEELKSVADKKLAEIEGNDMKLLERKMKALTNMENLQTKIDNLKEKSGRVFERLQKGYEAAKKTVIDLFNLNKDAKNADAKEVPVHVDSLKETIKEAKTKLSDMLIAKKAEVEAKIKNSRLLDSDDAVAKAFKTLSKYKNYAVGGLVAAAVLSAMYFLFGNNKNDNNGKYVA